MYLDEAKKLFEASANVAHDQVRPCTEADMKEIEHSFGGPLPSAYAEFLRWMGRGAGPFLAGSDVFFPAIIGLNDDARALLSENSFPIPLPSNAMVFYMHQGYRFLFWRSEGSNPPIYSYREGQAQEGFGACYPSFSDFMLAQVQDYIRVTRDLNRGRHEQSTQH